MSYSLQFQPAVEKDLKPLPKTILLRLLREIIALQDEPFPQTAIKLTGVDNLYRVRVGDYRIIYEVDQTAQRVIVHYARHRREVYDHL
jgi:mRNA interferase RelE/StbE